MIGDGVQEPMPVRLTAPQRKEFDSFGREIDVSAYQAMRPSTIDKERVAEQGHPTEGIGIRK